MSGTIYQYRVECPGRRAVKVKGANRLEATEQAAKVWGVAWMAVARQCRVEREKEVKGRGRIHAPGAGGDGPGRRGDRAGV